MIPASLQEFFPGLKGEVALATIVCGILSLFLFRKKRDIPMARGGVPLLGHAVAYQKDPAAFLEQQEKAVGSIFRINLAGRHMVVIGSDARAMKQIATLPESTMSARKAVADIGFKYTLGNTNLYEGTDWHKRILKDFVYGANGRFKESVLSDVLRSIDEAFYQETLPTSPLVTDAPSKSIVQIDDLFILVRRVTLRAMLNYLIGPAILQDGNAEALLTEFTTFQDAVENATAKAAVLPSFLSVPLFLKPVARMRHALAQKLAVVISSAWKAGSDEGPWLEAFRERGISSEEAAQLTIGLMFAAHKNPAIGAAQCFSFLVSSVSPEQQEASKREASTLWEDLKDAKWSSTQKALLKAETLRQCVLETMRLTAHSLGAIRTAQESFVLEAEGGRTFSIEKGDFIAVSHITMHQNPMVWGPDASSFRLDRWVIKAHKDDVACPMDEYTLTTFSHGVHKCPGERLALAMMEMTLAVLLKRGARPITKDMPEIDFERATLAQRKGKIPLLIKTGK